MLHRLGAAFVVIIMFLTLLSGCAMEESLAQPRPEQEYGGTLVYALEEDVSSFATVLASSQAAYVVTYQIHEPLVRYEASYKIVGALAESWEVSSDGLVWTFKLRDGVRWHDSKSFTSGDVKFTFELLLDPASNCPRRREYLFIQRIDTPDELSVQFYLREPQGDFLDKMTVGIMSEEHVAKLGGLENYDRSPVGTGPFKFKEHVPGERIVLEANTLYWQGRPYLDKVVFRPIDDWQTRLEAFAKAEVHYVSGVSFEHLKSIEAKERFTLYKVPALSFAYLGLNNRNQLFRDIRVREALSYAVDQNAIIREALGGYAFAAYGPYSPANEYYHNPGVKKFGYNPEMARQLLDAAGYKLSKDQIRQNVLGNRLEFSVMLRAGDDTWAHIASMCQKWFLEIGVKMNLEYVDWGTMNKRLDEREYEAAMLTFVPGPDPDQYMLWHSSAIHGGYNDWCYTNPDVDKLLELGRNQSEQPLRRDTYFQVQEVLAADVPAVWLYHPYTICLLNEKFKGMTPEPMGQHSYLHRVYEAAPDSK